MICISGRAINAGLVVAGAVAGAVAYHLALMAARAMTLTEIRRAKKVVGDVARQSEARNRAPAPGR